MMLLRDENQPFVFDVSFKNGPYRLEFYDTASPEEWTRLTPDLIVLCYDISSRLSLINIQRYVSTLVSCGMLAKSYINWYLIVALVG